MYALTGDSFQIVKEKYFEELSEIIERVPLRKELLILGDINSRVGREVIDGVLGPYGEEAENDNGQRLKEVCELYKLTIMNTVFKHRDINKYTWENRTRNLKSIIDYVLARKKREIIIQDVKVNRGPECGTDHYMVIAKVAFPVNRVLRKPTDSGRREVIHEPYYNLHLLQDESIRNLYNSRLQEKLRAEEDWNACKLYGHLKHCIHSAAREALGTQEGKYLRNYWITPEVLNVINKKSVHIKNG